MYWTIRWLHILVLHFLYNNIRKLSLLHIVEIKQTLYERVNVHMVKYYLTCLNEIMVYSNNSSTRAPVTKNIEGTFYQNDVILR